MLHSQATPPISPEPDFSFTWLGVAGLVFKAGEQVLAIDPFLSRPPLSKIIFGNLNPAVDKIQAAIPWCTYILVSHAHHDHLMDVPAIMAYTGAHVFASPNACELLIAMGAETGKIHPIGNAEQLQLGAFQVEVTPGSHIWLPLPISGRLPKHLHHPPRLFDFKKDLVFSFNLHLNGIKIAFVPTQPVAADLIFTYPYPARLLKKVLGKTPQKIIIPLHWDNLFQPLQIPVKKPGWKERLILSCFSNWLHKWVPAARLFVPQYFREVDVEKLLSE